MARAADLPKPVRRPQRAGGWQHYVKTDVERLIGGKRGDSRSSENWAIDSRRLEGVKHKGKGAFKDSTRSDTDGSPVPPSDSRRLEGVKHKGDGACRGSGKSDAESSPSMDSSGRLQGVKHKGFGACRDSSKSETESSPSVDSRRLEGIKHKGTGPGANGMLPRHMRSDVDRLVFGHDIDGSEFVQAVDGAAQSYQDRITAAAPPPQPPKHAIYAPPPTKARPAAVAHPRATVEATAEATAGNYAPPSAGDLFALYRLHGGDRTRIVYFLAAQWGADPVVIAPTVHSWLNQLPPLELLPLPSRSRTSPSMLPLIGATTTTTTISANSLLRPDRMVKPQPAATAPVYGSAPLGPASSRLALALSGLHSASARLNGSSKGKAYSQLGRINGHHPMDADAAQDMYVLPHHEGAVDFSPVRLSPSAIAAVPEGAPLVFDDGDDAALVRGLIMRERLRGEISPDLQEQRRAASTLSRSWRNPMRF